MKLLISLLTTLSIALNTVPCNLSIKYETPRIIDAYILAYDAMYSGDKEPPRDFIILDMESIYFTDTTYVDREKAIKHFQRYNKPVLNASLFRLQQIGLADKMGQLKINGDLLMITNVTPDNKKGLVIEGSKWFGPIAAYHYRIRFKIINRNWKVVEIKSLGVSWDSFNLKKENLILINE